MKILIAGDWHSELHEQPMSDTFTSLGHQVVAFKWFKYFTTGNIFLILRKIQRKFLMGWTINRINKDLFDLVCLESPQVLFIYRGDLIYGDTLLNIKRHHPRTLVIGYNNDDPFSTAYPDRLWRHFKKAIPCYDLLLAYRQQNLTDFKQAGAKNVKLFRSWFIPSRNYPINNSDSVQVDKKFDVVFVGHYENDGRLEYLEEIVRQGINLKLYGPGYDWDPVLQGSALLRSQIPVNLVWGDEYNRALNSGKIALCFFSTLNRDTYTRRCFEIPASGTTMLCQYSDDMAEMFTPDKEAVYFSSCEEMIKKIQCLLADETRMNEIANAGTKRAWADGHDIESRIKNLIDWIQLLSSDNENETDTFDNRIK